MELLYNKTPQAEFDKIHVLILALMKTNKEELGNINGYGAIADNNKSENIFYIVCFTAVPYTTPKYVESYGNQLESGGLIWNAIYTSPGQQKSSFYVDT